MGDYDRRVPILFWRPGVPGTTIERTVDTTDILPTIAAMIGLRIEPGAMDGHCLDAVATCSATPVGKTERGQL